MPLIHPRRETRCRPVGSGSYRVLPEWLRDYIADQGQFVLLECGHRENIGDRGVLLIVGMQRYGKRNNTQVLCERCNQFVGIERHMKFQEYANIPVKKDSDIPLF